jgi:hypothetical protein
VSEYDQILRLLDDPAGEIRAAATLVLARLRPVRPELRDWLRHRLVEASVAERSYLVDALAATEDVSVLPDLLPFAEISGSIAEQTVRILRRFDAAALAAIEERHRGEAGWRSGAYVKAVAGIYRLESIEMLMRRLDGCEWDQARATSICLVENFDAFPREAQIRLAELVRARLDDESADRDDFAVTTCLRLAQLLPLDVPLDSVLAFVGPERIGAVRRHAIQSLGGFVLDDGELARARGILHESLFDSSFDAVVKPALEVLEAWRDRPASIEDLRPLLDSPHAFAVRYALEELSGHLERGSTAGLEIEDFEAKLDATFPQVRRAAMLGLARFDGGPRQLLDRLRADENRFLAREYGAALADSLGGADHPLARDLLESFIAGREDHNEDAIIEFFAQLDREHFNAALSAWARATLAAKEGATGAADAVVSRLQPLVRLRHSDEENRFLLALANLALAQQREREDARYRRCIDLIAPLARTWGYSVTDRVMSEESLDGDDRLDIAAGLCAKGPVEREAARVILEGLPETLSDKAAERREELLASITARDPEGDPS